MAVSDDLDRTLPSLPWRKDDAGISVRAIRMRMFPELRPEWRGPMTPTQAVFADQILFELERVKRDVWLSNVERRNGF